MALGSSAIGGAAIAGVTGDPVFADPAATGLASSPATAGVTSSPAATGLMAPPAPVSAPPAGVGLGVEPATVGVDAAPASFGCSVSVARVYGNGDFPPFGGEGSIPNNYYERGPKMFVMGSDQQKQIMLAMQGALVWKPTEMEIHLFKNNVVPTKQTIAADLTEPEGDWYTAKDTIDITLPALNNDENWSSVTKTTTEFVYSGTDDPETIYGYYMLGFDGKYLGAELFPEPQIMGKVGDSVRFTPQLWLNLEGAAAVSE